MSTRHADGRAQQRGIPPMIQQLLDLYGEEEHDGHGGVIRYFSKESINQMERDLGHRIVSRLSEWMRAYKVDSTDGRPITCGHRYRRIRRK
jgi:hypothetical protein